MHLAVGGLAFSFFMLIPRVGGFFGPVSLLVPYVFKWALPEALTLSYTHFVVNKNLQYLSVVACSPPESFVPHAHLNKIIQDAVGRRRTCGVHVLFAPSGSGKTTASRYVLRNLITNSNISGVLELDGGTYQADFKGQLLPWISSLKGLAIPARYTLDQILDPGTVVFIDQFDNLFTTELHHNRIQTMITSAAELSARTKTFSVLIIVKSMDRFRQIISWNDNTKIRGVFADDDYVFTWQPEELTAVLDRHLQWVTFTPENKQLLDDLIQSRNITTVGRLLELIDTYRL
eukprot:m.259979 g.259979  ORF g.259979 m.259979 type:complete len:289 (-) comp23117_c0_seq1:59-925(-)